MYDPVFLYCNCGISENPTYVSKVFQVSGFWVLDCNKVIVPPALGKLFGEPTLYPWKLYGSIKIWFEYE